MSEEVFCLELETLSTKKRDVNFIQKLDQHPSQTLNNFFILIYNWKFYIQQNFYIPSYLTLKF